MRSIQIEHAFELRNWLRENHDSTESVWLVKWKKDSGHPYLSYDEIVDQLICFGWVDSLPKRLDDKKTMLRISPRNPKSNWSGINKKRVMRLLGHGLMEDSGMKLVDEAKKNGAWNFLDDVEQLIVPSDLASALQEYDKAEYYYNRFPDSSKRSILEWIKSARQIMTRENRINETAKKASQNIKANHPKGRNKGPSSS